jgi:hypothetical protein
MGPNTVSETLFNIKDRTMDDVQKCDSYRKDEMRNSHTILAAKPEDRSSREILE